MQVAKFLHKFVFNALPKVHQYRRKALMCTVSSLLDQDKIKPYLEEQVLLICLNYLLCYLLLMNP